MSEKCGVFDWIVNSNQLFPFITEEFIGHVLAGSRVLVVGCGTSTLSKDLLQLGLERIISIDNDSMVIEHMQNQCRDIEKLEWGVYDIVAPNEVQNSITLDSNSFNLVIDKGTLDAVLVEGSIYTMLHEIHRVLRTGGCYIVCSLHDVEFTTQLLSLPALAMTVNCYETTATNGDTMIGTIAICRKTKGPDDAVDSAALQQQELEFSTRHFQVEYPLLTNSVKEKLLLEYSLYCDEHSCDGIPLSVAYHMMFDNELRQSYNFDLFMEDISIFELEDTRSMNFNECVKFIQSNQ